MYCQHDASDDVAMLPEIHVDMHELTNDDVEAMSKNEKGDNVV